MRRAWLTLCVFTMCLSAHASSAFACPMCKFALESDDPQPRAYITSILFMLGMITTLFSAVAGLLVWVSRKETQALKDAGYEHVIRNAVSAPQPEAQG
jgi:uncharacterized membrane protein